jgi:uncharacterized protein YkwD
LSFSQFGLNWFDIVIVVVFVLYAIEGFTVGFIVALMDLISFVLSYILALAFYSPIGNLLVRLFSIPGGFAKAGGFFIIAFLSEIVLNILSRIALFNIKRGLNVYGNNQDEEHDAFWFLNHFGGIFPAIISAYVLLAFLTTLLISLPLSPFIQKSISSSQFGKALVVYTQGFEKTLNGVFGQAVQDTLNFITIEPQSNEVLKLHFTTTKVTVDENAEKQMRGIPALEMSSALTKVARDYSKDMFARGYFSHFNPEGRSPFDRLTAADIVYQAAGENLALAPNVDLAMQGLMNSPGHKANILSKDFGRIGIGVIDGGIYGQMFTQEFTD